MNICPNCGWVEGPNFDTCDRCGNDMVDVDERENQRINHQDDMQEDYRLRREQ